MKWLLVLVLVLALAAGGAYYYFQLNPPERYSTNEVYLTRYASVMIPGGGVYGFPPGTKLLLDSSRRASPGTVAVTDGTHKMDVETEALTRNPKIAQELADADRQGQTQAVAGVSCGQGACRQGRVRRADGPRPGHRPPQRQAARHEPDPHTAASEVGAAERGQ